MVGTRRLELLILTASKLIYSIPSTSYIAAGAAQTLANTRKAKFQWIEEERRLSRLV
jgi:hypothetical protein